MDGITGIDCTSQAKTRVVCAIRGKTLRAAGPRAPLLVREEELLDDHDGSQRDYFVQVRNSGSLLVACIPASATSRFYLPTLNRPMEQACARASGRCLLQSAK